MTTLHFPAKDDWKLSRAILDAALSVIDGAFEVSREYHVPYVAGYSEDGKTIYIDSRMPEGFESKSGKYISTDQYLILHEAIEKILMMFLLADGITDTAKQHIYQLCHQIAYRVENDAVQADDIDLKEYSDFMGYWVNKLGKEDYNNLPPNLDPTPYDDEHDTQL